MASIHEVRDMTSMRSIASIALAVALGSGLMPAMAQGAPGPDGANTMPGRDGHSGWMEGRMAAQLNLTEAQKASLKDIQAKHKDSFAAKKKAAMAARKAFFEAIQKPETAPETLKALHRTLSDLEFDRMLEFRAMRQEMRAVLNPEQREKAARMEGRMEGMRMARGGRGWDGGMGMGMGMGMRGKNRPEGGPVDPGAPAAQ